MKDDPDLFAWAENRPAIPEGVVIDALPKLLARIRIEQAYRIPRPTGGAVVLSMSGRAA